MSLQAVAERAGVSTATVSRVLNASGYEVVVSNTLYRLEQLAASLRMMIGRRVAGLALIVSEVDEGIVQELTEGKTPVVL